MLKFIDDIKNYDKFILVRDAFEDLSLREYLHSLNLKYHDGRSYLDRRLKRHPLINKYLNVHTGKCFVWWEILVREHMPFKDILHPSINELDIELEKRRLEDKYNISLNSEQSITNIDTSNMSWRDYACSDLYVTPNTIIGGALDTTNITFDDLDSTYTIELIE